MNGIIRYQIDKNYKNKNIKNKLISLQKWKNNREKNQVNQNLNIEKKDKLFKKITQIKLHFNKLDLINCVKLEKFKIRNLINIYKR